MISSAGGLVATPLLGAYSASKFEVEAIADVLRQELAPWGLPPVQQEGGGECR
jgi:short-subunit dehydrogenase